MSVQDRLTRADFRNILFLILSYFAFVSVNFSFGIGEDTDAYRILRFSQEWLNGKGYHVSRAWGNPLYELWAYPVVAKLGDEIARSISFLFGVASIVWFYRLLKKTALNSTQAFWGAFCLTSHPLVIIAGNTLLETSQALFFMVGCLFYLNKYFQKRDLVSWALFWSFLSLAFATRPDSIIFVLASGFYFIFILRELRVRYLSIGIVIFIALGILPFLMLYGFNYFPNMSGFPSDPWARKAQRAILGFVAFTGLPSAIFLLSSFKRVIPMLKMSLGGLFWIYFALLLSRYSLLPDKLEYLLFLLPICLLAITPHMTKRYYSIVWAAIFLPNLMQLHFFERKIDLNSSKISSFIVNPGISAGVFWQERRERLKLEYSNADLVQTIQEAAIKFKCSTFSTVSKGEDCSIMPIERTRFFAPDRTIYKNKNVNLSRLVVYPLPDNRGWRQWIKFKDWRRVSADDFGEIDVKIFDPDYQTQSK